MTALMQVFYSARCLLVLDQAEVVLQEKVNNYRNGYEAYGELLWQMGARRHDSCLLILSQEPLPEIARLERETCFVKSLRLTDLLEDAVRALLQSKGLSLTPTTAIAMYSPRYLALQQIAQRTANLTDA
jgi:hypothetical protein